MKVKKIIIFSDMHASMEAAEAIRKYMEDQDIQVALNLGDFTSNGPFPCEVFDVIMKDSRIISVKGYDEGMLFDKIKAADGIGQGEWLIQKLGAKRMSELEKLPSAREVTVNGMKILMCHNNGWADLTQQQAHGTKFNHKKYKLIAFGGSHMQELTHSKGMFSGSQFIDPGALKPDETHQGKFAVLNFEGKEAEITFHTIAIHEKWEPAKHQLEKEKAVQQQEKAQDEQQQDTFLYINSKRGDESNVISIADEVMDKIIDIGVKQCKYVCIGCWKQEKKVINEILYYLKCREVRESEESDQVWYIGEITEEVKKLIKNNRKNIDGRLKWFELSFQNTLTNDNAIYSIFHYGKESFLRRLTLSELYNMEELLERYNILYYLPEEEEKKQKKEI